MVFGAVEEVLNLSLAEGASEGGGGVEVHTLVSRAMRFTDTETDRTSGLKQAATAALISAFEQAADPQMWLVLEQLVAHGRELVGVADSVLEVDLLRQVARFEYARGSYGVAVADQQREVIASKKLLGEGHPDTLNSMGTLAVSLFALGDLEGARDLNKQTLEARIRVLGEEHPDTLSSMGDLALTLYALGDLERARDLSQQTLEARRRILGEEHADTLSSMSNLASTLYALGDLEGARVLNQQTLDTRIRVLGEEHPRTLISMNNLAKTLHDLGDLTESRGLSQQTLEAKRRVLGEEHPETTTSAWNLYRTLELGDQAEASAVLGSDLKWLLDRDPDSLGRDQRTIQRRLLERMRGGNDAS